MFNFDGANPVINEIANLTKIDIISLDIEGCELNCLYSLDLKNIIHLF